MEAWNGVLHDLAGFAATSPIQGMGEAMLTAESILESQMASVKRNLESSGQDGGDRKRVVIPCRFFVRGACTNGDSCRFSHDIAYIQASQGGAGEMAVMGSMPDAVLPDPSSKGYKTLMCRFFLSGGRCTRGELCPYAHGVEELRGTLNEKNMQIMTQARANNEAHEAHRAMVLAHKAAQSAQASRAPRGGQAGASRQTTASSLLNHQSITQTDLLQAIAAIQASGFTVNAPDLTGVAHAGADIEIKVPASSHEVLKVFVDKSNGDRLGINIDQAPEGILVTSVEEIGLVAVWNQFRPAERIEAGDKILAVNSAQADSQAMLHEIKKNQVLLLTVKKTKPAALPPPPPPPPPALANIDSGMGNAAAAQQSQTPNGSTSALLCKFFEQGRCSKGAECAFAHGREKLDLTAAPLDLSRFKTKLCKFAAAGHVCTRAENCPFAHSLEEIQTNQAMVGQLNAILGQVTAESGQVSDSISQIVGDASALNLTNPLNLGS